MIRVVLDTNVLISALLNPQGAPAQLFVMTILEPDPQLCVSGDVFAEYEEVVRRPRLRRSLNEIDTTLQAIRSKGLWVRTSETVRVCSDPKDNIFLECAQAADADYLVTGNARHFPSTWKTTRIVSPRQFLDIFG